MPLYTVSFAASASTTVRDVEADTPDDAIDGSGQDIQASLCHQCAGHLDLGDFEPVSVEDEDGEDVTPAGLTDTAAERVMGTVLDWIVALDEPGNTDRQTVTLTQIITRAQEALAKVRPE
jgi:hypothetical protein